MSTAAAFLETDRNAPPVPAGSDEDYRAMRSMAIALAAQGSVGSALEQLNRAWRAGSPCATERALDLGWVRLLLGHPRCALEALRSAMHDESGYTPADTYRLVGECVRADPSVRESALRLALAARSPLQLARIAVAALAARPIRGARPPTQVAA